MKVLFLDVGLDSSSEYFRKERMKNKNCTSKCLYKNIKKGLLFKLIQFLGIYLFSPILYLIYGDWKYEVDKYDLFIVVSRKSSKYAIKYIQRKAPNKRIVIWYWNLVTKREMHPEYCKKLNCETWSFDKLDCQRYNMKFGDTYYFKNDYNLDNMKTKYNLFFVGINRPGREEILNQFKEFFDKNNLTYKFNLTAIPNQSKKIQQKYSERMDYQEIINCIKESDAILDLNRDNQSGMTLRPLEAIFYGKKLITNNINIKDYKAYDKDNTFIFDDKNIDFDKIKYFLLNKTRKNNQDKIKRYSFDSWLDRIIKNEEA